MALWPKGLNFRVVGPEWFEAITCNIWLRLEYRPLDSAWFFNTQVWYFQPPGPFWDPRIWIWVPAGPGTFLGQKRGPEKHDFVEEMVPHGVWGGSVRGEWIVGYPGGLWAGPFPPKPCQKIILQGFACFFFMGPGNPWWALAILGGPLVGTRGFTTPSLLFTESLGSHVPTSFWHDRGTRPTSGK